MCRTGRQILGHPLRTRATSAHPAEATTASQEQDIVTELTRRPDRGLQVVVVEGEDPYDGQYHQQQEHERILTAPARARPRPRPCVTEGGTKHQTMSSRGQVREHDERHAQYTDCCGVMQGASRNRATSLVPDIDVVQEGRLIATRAP